MVFIHGGAFNYGSGSLDFYSPEYLLDENVIIVTINYRLNALGKYTEIQFNCYYFEIYLGIFFILTNLYLQHSV